MKQQPIEAPKIAKSPPRPEPQAPQGSLSFQPQTMRPADLLRLQRAFGNQAVGRLLNHNGQPMAIQRDLDDDIDEIRQEMNKTKDPLLQNILAEVLEMYGASNVTTAYGHSAQESHVLPKGKHDSGRSYEVVIDDNQIKDKAHRQSYIVHELMHVSADQKYKINQLLDKEMLNMLYKSVDSQKFEFSQQNYMLDMLDELKLHIEREESTLGKGMAAHLKERVGRAGVVDQEFDTVMSELLFYVTKQGVDKSTETYKMIHQLAQGAYDRRHNEVPILPPVKGGSPAKKEGCFITTACMVAMGLPDDCDELNSLRAFRDGYVAGLPFGPALIQDYYELAPGLVAQIESRPDAAKVLSQLYQEISQAVQFIKTGQPEAALNCYMANVARIVNGQL